MRPGKVYTLTNPVGNEIFYVGSTTVPLNERLNIHWCCRNRPHGEVGRYMIEMTLRPIIEEVESFDIISNIDLRKAELFWIIQLKALGFPIVNTKVPFKDANEIKKAIVSVPGNELMYIKSKLRYVSYIKTTYNITGLSLQLLSKIIDKGTCNKSTYKSIRLITKHLMSLDYSKFVLTPRALMHKLTDEQINALRQKINGSYYKAQDITGIHYCTLMRAIDKGVIRYDKMNKIEQFINVAV